MGYYGKLGKLHNVVYDAYVDFDSLKEDKTAFCLEWLIRHPAKAQSLEVGFKFEQRRTKEENGRTYATFTVSCESEFFDSDDSSMQTVAAHVEFAVREKLLLAATNFLEYSETKNARRDWRKSKVNDPSFDEIVGHVQDMLDEVSPEVSGSDDDSDVSESDKSAGSDNTSVS